MKQVKRVVSILLALCLVGNLFSVSLITAAFASVKSDIEESRTIFDNVSGTMALKSDGSLWKWENIYSSGLLEGITEPIKILDDVVMYNQTYSHSAAVKSDGTLWTWGSNLYGQLCDGTTDDRQVPTKVMDDVVSVDVGDNYTLILKTDGSVWTCGSDAYGCLGNGTNSSCNTPQKIMENVRLISAHYDHSFAIKFDDSLWAWGYNGFGILGDGTSNDSSVPKLIMQDVKTIASDAGHSSFAIKNDNTLWGWGWGYNGEVGDGKTDDHFTPQKILDDVKSVSAAGLYTTVAIKTDGTLWAWGLNDSWQINQTTNNYTLPLQVMDDVVDTYAGRYHTFAVKTDGSLWVWGEEKYGSMIIDSESPKKILDDVICTNDYLATKKDGSLWKLDMYQPVLDEQDGQPLKVLDDVKLPDILPEIIDPIAGSSQHINFLSRYDSLTRKLVFGNDADTSSYTLADEVDASCMEQLLNKYVLITCEADAENALIYTVTDIQPVESAIGTVTATGEHSLTIDDVEYPVREDYILGSYEGQEVLYHTYNGTIMGFDVLEEKSGTLECWNSTTGRVTIDGTEYPTNDLTDLTFLANLDEYMQKDVTFLTAGSSDYCPLLEITGFYYPGGKLEDFDPTIYHATWLAKGGNDAGILNDDTPSDIMMDILEESGSAAALDVWRSFELVFDSLSDITTLAKFATGVDQKDMYSALILTALEAKASCDIIPSQAEEGVKLSKSLISNVSSALKADYGIELNDNDELQDVLSRMPGVDVDAYLEKQTSEWFKKTQPDLGDLGKSFKWISNGAKAVGTAEDYVEYISACITLSQTDEYIEEVLNLAYQKSSSVFGPSYSLTLAFKECLDMFSSGTEEMLEKIQAGTITMLGEGALEYVVGDILWGEVTSYINTACPEVAILQIGYTAGKTISSWLCNTDDAAEQYLKMDYITDIETILNAVYNDLRLDFSSKKDVKTAGTYLSAMSFSFQLRDGDCDNAYKYVDAVETSLLSKIEQAFGKESNEELKNAIQGIQKNYITNHVGAEINWIFSLEDDYPGSGLYEQYEQTIDETRNRILEKEITAACPVDVYVYDQSDNVVASVVNGRVSCSADDLMIALLGEQKVVRLYNGADYRIEYVGSDTGEMDITILEFAEDEAIARTVNYYDIALTDGKTYSLDADDETLKPYELVDTSESNIVDWDYDSMAASTAHTVKVISGTLQQDGEIHAETTASKGETMQLNAYVPNGYKFVRWEATSENTAIADSAALSTTMIMPDEDITVTAVMEKISSDGGSSSGGSTGGSTGGGSSGGSTSTPSNPTTDDPVAPSEPDEPTTPDFTDVSSDAWYYEAIQYVAEHGLMNGYGNGKFGPNDDVTRAQFAQIIYNKEGKPAVTKTSSFADVVSGAWYFDAVTWAADNKVVNGYGNGKYGPNDNITREQLAVMLWRYAGEPENSGSLGQFTDGSDASSYAVTALEWAVENGIVNGKGNGVLDPQGKATRAEVAAMLMRYCENVQKGE